MKDNRSIVSPGCIFCGKAPTTNEHLIPEWMARVIYQDPRHRPDINLHWVIDRDIHRSWLLKKDLITFEANCVCDKCNSGWMNRIEIDAQRTMMEMIGGNLVKIRTEDAAAIGKWLCLKTIIHRYTQSPPHPIGQRALSSFVNHHTPPRTWHAWIMRYGGKRQLRMHSGSIFTPFQQVTTTFILGFLAAKVLGLSEEISIEPDPDIFLRVWPPPVGDEIVTWPPRKSIDDTAFDALVKSFPEET